MFQSIITYELIQHIYYLISANLDYPILKDRTKRLCVEFLTHQAQQLTICDQVAQLVDNSLASHRFDQSLIPRCGQQWLYIEYERVNNASTWSCGFYSGYSLQLPPTPMPPTR